MCPIEVDQTERRPQAWQILAPRVRKICKLELPRSTDDITGLNGYLFHDEVAWDAWSKLARPVAVVRTPEVSIFMNPVRRSRPLSRLEKLPSELIALILHDQCLEKDDLVALGLTCQVIWMHLLQYVERDCAMFVPPLADVELACTGTYLVDLPEPFVKDKLAESSVQVWYGGPQCLARKINWSACSTYCDVEKENPEDLWMAAIDAYYNTAAVMCSYDRAVPAGIPTKIFHKMTKEMLRRCLPLKGYTSDSHWVLRNLTTREYIRCKPGSSTNYKRGYVDHPSIPLRVDDALLLRIAWTLPLRSWEGPNNLDIHRGSWAGHCFDIVLLEQVQTEIKEWKDVTNDVVSQAVEVAEAMPHNSGAKGIYEALNKDRQKVMDALCEA